jgi:hypothetical protein
MASLIVAVAVVVEHAAQRIEDSQARKRKKEKGK